VRPRAARLLLLLLLLLLLQLQLLPVPSTLLEERQHPGGLLAVCRHGRCLQQLRPSLLLLLQRSLRPAVTGRSASKRERSLVGCVAPAAARAAAAGWLLVVRLRRSQPCK
jgi:hypothetical protein